MCVCVTLHCNRWIADENHKKLIFNSHNRYMKWMHRKWNKWSKFYSNGISILFTEKMVTSCSIYREYTLLKHRKNGTVKYYCSVTWYSMNMKKNNTTTPYQLNIDKWTFLSVIKQFDEWTAHAPNSFRFVGQREKKNSRQHKQYQKRNKWKSNVSIREEEEEKKPMRMCTTQRIKTQKA